MRKWWTVPSIFIILSTILSHLPSPRKAFIYHTYLLFIILMTVMTVVYKNKCREMHSKNNVYIVTGKG